MDIINSLGTRRSAVAADLGSRIQLDHAWMADLLRGCSSKATAEDEIVKTVRALVTYDRELPALNGRTSFGDVAVALPFNNPLYSYILYCVGVAMGGSKVIVRPSAITRDVVEAINERYQEQFGLLGISLYRGSGKDFLDTAAKAEDVRTLLFTGSYNNLERILPTFPPDKGVVYCGSGINPFVVTPDGFRTQPQRAGVVDLAVRSRLYNSGQDCLCAERFYVHDTIFDEFRTMLIERLIDVPCGDFTDDSSVITPLVKPIAERLESIVLASEHTTISQWGKPPAGNLVHPQVWEVSIESTLMTTEKFAPIFTLARYREPADLDRALAVEHRFGATICGGYSSDVLNSYPHVTTNTSVIEEESEDAHAPFGGRLRSGFSVRSGSRKDGPILYSIESTY